MHARLFPRINKPLKYFFKAFLFCFLTIAISFGIHETVRAQTVGSGTCFDGIQNSDESGIDTGGRCATVETTYKEFYTLFNPKQGQPATLEVLAGMWKTLPEQTHANDLTLRFIGGFNFDGNQGKDADWFWTHVKDFSRTVVGGSREDIFVVRLCPVDASGNPDEANCVFSDAPYAELCKNGNANTNGQKPCTTEQLSENIYHTAMVKNGGFLASALAVKTTSAFDVNIKGLDFHKLGNGKLSDSSNIVLQPGSTYSADLWYCATASTATKSGLPELTEAYVTSHEKSDYLIRNFNKLCGDQSSWPAYFRIAQVSTPISVPGTPTDIKNANDNGAAPSTGSGSSLNSGDFLPSCSWFNLTGSGTFLGCVAVGVFYIVYKPISWFAGVMGNLFDFFLGYSISDESYRAEFAVTGWRIVRDISNIFFIVILIWAGMVAVFDSEKMSLKKVVPVVIINALLINFSLFGTRVIIDLSNIVTRIFYNNVEVCSGKCDDKNKDGKPDNLKQGITQYKPLSEKILSSFNPQTLFNPQYLSPQNMLPSNKGDQSLLFGSQTTGNTDSTVLSVKNTEPDPVVFIIISLFASIILFAIAAMFWNTAFMFLGRIIGLYIVMIFSPFAVLTRGNVPIVGNIESLKWSSWWKELSNYALLAPIFVFFLYVIYTFISADWMQFAQIGSGSLLEKIIGVGIPMLLIFMMIKQGVAIAKKYAGTVGSMVQNFVNSTVGGVSGLIGGTVGLAAGGVGFLGRNLVGRGVGFAARNIGTGRDKDGKRISLASRLASSADSNRFARYGNNFLKWNRTSSWDPRNISAKVGGRQFTALGTFNKGVGLLGKPIGESAPKDNFSGKLGLGKDAGKGGLKKQYEDRLKAKKEKLMKKMSFDHLSDTEAKAAWQAHVEKKSLKLAKEELEKSLATKTEEYVSSKDDGPYRFQKLQLEEQKKKREEAEGIIKTSTAALRDPNLTDERRTELTAKIDTQKKTISGIDSNIKDIEKIRSEKYAELIKKHGKYEDSDEYKKDLLAKQKEMSKEVDKYGEVKNGKTLTTAMHAEYAEDLRKSSMWMFNGKPSNWARGIFGGAAGGGTVAGGAALGIAGWTIPFAAAIAGYVQEQADIMNQATKEIIDGAKKSIGKGTKKAKLEGTHKMLKEKLETTLKKAYGEDIKNIDELLATNQKYIEEGLAMRSVQMEEDIKNLQKDLVAAQKAYLDAVGTQMEKDLKTARDKIAIEIAYQKQELSRLPSLKSEVDRADDALERYTRTEAEGEEKAKKKAEEEKKGGKSPDEGKKAGKES